MSTFQHHKGSPFHPDYVSKIAHLFGKQGKPTKGETPPVKQPEVLAS